MLNKLTLSSLACGRHLKIYLLHSNEMKREKHKYAYIPWKNNNVIDNTYLHIVFLGNFIIFLQ